MKLILKFILKYIVPLMIIFKLLGLDSEDLSAKLEGVLGDLGI